MFVNIPKFGRAIPGKSQPVAYGRVYAKPSEEENRDAYLRMKQGGSMGMKRGSYADAVKKNNPRADQGQSKGSTHAIGRNQRCTSTYRWQGINGSTKHGWGD